MRMRPEQLQLCRKRQQRDVLCAFDCHGEPALVPRASSRHAAWKNLAALLNERREDFGSLVVDEIRFVHAEPANLLFANETPLASLRRAAGASAATRPALRTRSRRAGRLLLRCITLCHLVSPLSDRSIRLMPGSARRLQVVWPAEQVRPEQAALSCAAGARHGGHDDASAFAAASILHRHGR